MSLCLPVYLVLSVFYSLSSWPSVLSLSLFLSTFIITFQVFGKVCLCKLHSEPLEFICKFTQNKWFAIVWPSNFSVRGKKNLVLVVLLTYFSIWLKAVSLSYS